MNIYDYEQAFGAAEMTTSAMRRAIDDWFSLYYRTQATAEADPCQRIAYTVVNKICRTVFGEYRAMSDDPQAQQILSRLEQIRKQAVQLALIGGECYIKPCPGPEGFTFALISRPNALIFGRNAAGEPVDMGTLEHSCRGKYFYTLLERRRLDDQGRLIIENQLYRSLSANQLGGRVALSEHPDYAALAESYRFEKSMGNLGLVRVKTPMVNCVDGSAEAVSVYAAAVELIRNIDRNEAQLNAEFSRGESRILLSADLLGSNGLEDHLFVGLDEDVERTGITIFSPALREGSFLARKQEYLRNVESMIGLKRGMLSDANEDERTATEISASAAEYNLTVMDFQQMWQQALEQVMTLCGHLARAYGLPEAEDPQVQLDWGNGVLYDEEKLWNDYLTMVREGLIRPEVALGWRFDMPAVTENQQQKIRSRFMPRTKEDEI